MLIKQKAQGGIDGLQKCDLIAWDPYGEKLALLFNSWFTAGLIPECVKEGRTVLLPKSSDPLSLDDPANWRPITIGSMLLRPFSKVLHERWSAACTINKRQRGFIRAPGCSENLHILQSVVDACWMEKRPLAVVLIDVAKAFDSVAHEHLLTVLTELGLDEHITGLIRSFYTNGTTRIEVEVLDQTSSR